MNLRMTAKYISYILLVLAACSVPPAVLSFALGEVSAGLGFVIMGAAALLLGLALRLLFGKTDQTIYAREGFVVAGLSWIAISVLGTIPFMVSGATGSFIDALFESISGFTTTGASIFTDVEALGRGILFWRSFSHWIGGIGVLVFILAVVQTQKRGTGFTLHLLRAETTGPQVGKVLPKTKQSVRVICLIYLGLTLANAALLLAGGMPLFDAVCTAFGTVATGGFGIKNDSLASYSPYIQNVTTAFMLLASVNFTLYFFLIRREFRTVARDEELRLFLGIFAVGSAGVTASLLFSGYAGMGESLREAAFTVISMMSSTGFAVADYDVWPVFTSTVLIVVMIFGAMAGSTGGGFKTSRILILFKSMRSGIHRLLHPRSVKAVKINGKTIDSGVVAGTTLFLCVYCACLLGSFLLLGIDGYDLESTFTAVVATINNTGPGFGTAGPAGSYASFSPFSKVVLSFNMLLGRLEIFPILLLLNPSTWRRKA